MVDIPFSDTISDAILVFSKSVYLLALPSLLVYLLLKVGMLTTSVSSLTNRVEMGLLFTAGVGMNVIHIVRCFTDYKNDIILVPIAVANVIYEFILINSVVIINIICRDFMNSCILETKSMETMYTSTQRLVVRYGILKEGLSPIFFLHYTLSTFIIVTEAHDVYHLLDKKEYIQGFICLGHGIIALLIIYIISSISDNCHSVFKKLNDHSRSSVLNLSTDDKLLLILGMKGVDDEGKATALNFFKAEMSMVPSVLGTAAAYLIIMIQTTV
ncbi:uncharacterized protein LOC111710425 [Eurytemora carolleeae]|uniref:uncharacterized protein LOC111710425 n=1 Tax=Eurytemora carolleeae TaxID=1294199 RepID=UPI000C78B69C|nr:uncharacterized protein LOC111710425 [Eurytemora carolleeae]|eukprot:XP_023340277.1 uncharacterized protein LOC111710425 [Eurytemora affinis]